MEFFRKLFNHSASPKAEVTLAWGKGMDGLDDVSAIELATKQLNADAKKDIFKDEQYLEALLAVDEKMHTVVERITAHYINIDNMSIDLDLREANLASISRDFLTEKVRFGFDFAFTASDAQCVTQMLLLPAGDLSESAYAAWLSAGCVELNPP